MYSLGGFLCSVVASSIKILSMWAEIPDSSRPTRLNCQIATRERWHRVSTLNPILRSRHILWFESVLYSSTIVIRFEFFFSSTDVVFFCAQRNTYLTVLFFFLQCMYIRVSGAFNKRTILVSYTGMCLSRSCWIITLSLYKSGYGISTEPAALHKFIGIEIVSAVICEFAFTRFQRIIHRC